MRAPLRRWRDYPKWQRLDQERRAVRRTRVAAIASGSTPKPILRMSAFVRVELRTVVLEVEISSTSSLPLGDRTAKLPVALRLSVPPAFSTLFPSKRDRLVSDGLRGKSRSSDAASSRLGVYAGWRGVRTLPQRALGNVGQKTLKVSAQDRAITLQGSSLGRQVTPVGDGHTRDIAANDEVDLASRAALPASLFFAFFVTSTGYSGPTRILLHQRQQPCGLCDRRGPTDGRCHRCRWGPGAL
jgi:hypothetical protein